MEGKIKEIITHVKNFDNVPDAAAFLQTDVKYFSKKQFKIKTVKLETMLNVMGENFYRVEIKAERKSL